MTIRIRGVDRSDHSQRLLAEVRAIRPSLLRSLPTVRSWYAMPKHLMMTLADRSAASARRRAQPCPDRFRRAARSGNAF